MERLIPIVNQLQDAFSSLRLQSPIDLPQIAVVGSQSAGKSSVLENFVGREFLPRGSGIVTRRPLILQLINIARNQPEYATFLHKPNMKFTNFDQVKKEIERETDRVTGMNKNISPLPINLRLFSPNVVDITLVDLPGMTKVPVGDQPSDIGAQIKKMILEFIDNPRCLILAVTPANIDLANSDSLLLAKSVDPQGLRTIGVITKIDLMDRGTNCREILLNVTYPLKRGYIGIVNRSQADIESRMDINLSQKAEYEYFANHPSYRDIADQCGSRYLQNVLNKQLSDHIKKALPDLRKELISQLAHLEQEIDRYGGADLNTSAGRVKQIMQSLQTFSEEFDHNLGLRLTNNVKLDKLSLGNHVNTILNEHLPNAIRALKASPESIRNDISISIQNSQGVKNSLFTPEAAFNAICRDKILKLKPVTDRIISSVVNVLHQVIDAACMTAITSYINLQEEVKDVCSKFLIEAGMTAKEQAILFLDIEHSHINTFHPDFLKSSSSNTLERNLTKERSKSESTDELLPPSNINDPNSTVVQKGFLSVPLSGLKGSKDYFFILRGETLCCYKDSEEKNLKFSLNINNCKYKTPKRLVIVLVHKENRNLTKDYKTLELTAKDLEQYKNWTAAFMSRGVFSDNEPVKGKKDTSGQNEILPGTVQMTPNSGQAALYRQIEMIKSLVEQYMKIVYKNQVDFMGKLVVHLLINKMAGFVKSDLVAKIYSHTNLDHLLDVSETERKRLSEMVGMQKTCRQALEVIDNVNKQYSSIFMNNEMPSPTSSTSRFNFDNEISSPGIPRYGGFDSSGMNAGGLYDQNIQSTPSHYSRTSSYMESSSIFQPAPIAQPASTLNGLNSSMSRLSTNDLHTNQVSAMAPMSGEGFSSSFLSGLENFSSGPQLEDTSQLHTTSPQNENYRNFDGLMSSSFNMLQSEYSKSRGTGLPVRPMPIRSQLAKPPPQQ